MTSFTRPRIASVFKSGLIGAVALGAFAGVGAAQIGAAVAQHIAPAQSVGSMIAARRASLTAANLPSPSETLYLRQRADYATEAEMIDGEIAVIQAEAQALQSFNLAAEEQLAERAARAAAFDEALEPKRREVRALGRTLREDRQRLEDRLASAESELRTTRRLREQARDAGLATERDVWIERERALEEERDRLRELLERVSQLAAVIG